MRTGYAIFHTVLFCLLNVPAFAQHVTSEWEFSGDRQPTYGSLAIGAADLPNTGCKKWPDALYARYVHLHSDFVPLSNDPVMRRKWRQSLVSSAIAGSDSLNHCIYGLLQDRFNEITEHWRKIHLPQCRVNYPQVHLEAADLLAELAEYAAAGSSMAGLMVLNKEEADRGPITLDPSVRYYLQRALDTSTPPGLHYMVEDLLVPDAGAELAPERKRFVDDAFGRGDYHAVLSTIDPC